MHSMHGYNRTLVHPSLNSLLLEKERYVMDESARQNIEENAVEGEAEGQR